MKLDQMEEALVFIVLGILLVVVSGESIKALNESWTPYFIVLMITGVVLAGFGGLISLGAPMLSRGENAP